MLAQIFGPFLAIVGLWMLIYGENVVKIMTSMKNSPSALYFSAVVNLLIGIVIINNFNMWDWQPMLVLTLVGWVMILRGVLGLFMPKLIIEWLMTNTSCMKTMGIVPFVAGLILIWTAYYM